MASRLVTSWGLGHWEETQVPARGYTVSLGFDENVPKTDDDDGCIAP